MSACPSARSFMANDRIPCAHLVQWDRHSEHPVDPDVATKRNQRPAPQPSRLRHPIQCRRTCRFSRALRTFFDLNGPLRDGFTNTARYRGRLRARGQATNFPEHSGRISRVVNLAQAALHTGIFQRRGRSRDHGHSVRPDLVRHVLGDSTWSPMAIRSVAAVGRRLPRSAFHHPARLRSSCPTPLATCQ